MGIPSHVWQSVLQYSRRASLHFSTGRCPRGPHLLLACAGTEAVRCAQAAHKPLGKLEGEASGSPHSGMASPTGPLGAPRSSASDDGRGCDGESGDPSYPPVVRKASLSSCDSESAPALEHCLSGSGSGFSDAGHVGTRVRARLLLTESQRQAPRITLPEDEVAEVKPSARNLLQRLALLVTRNLSHQCPRSLSAGECNCGACFCVHWFYWYTAHYAGGAAGRTPETQGWPPHCGSQAPRLAQPHAAGGARLALPVQRVRGLLYALHRDE